MILYATVNLFKKLQNSFFDSDQRYMPFVCTNNSSTVGKVGMWLLHFHPSLHSANQEWHVGLTTPLWGWFGRETTACQRPPRELHSSLGVHWQNTSAQCNKQSPKGAKLPRQLEMPDLFHLSCQCKSTLWCVPGCLLGQHSTGATTVVY